MTEALAAIEGFCRLEIQRRRRALSAEEQADHQRLAGWLRSLIDGATASPSTDLKQASRDLGRKSKAFDSTHLMESLGIKSDQPQDSADLIGDAARAAFKPRAAEPGRKSRGFDSSHLLEQLGIQPDSPAEGDRSGAAQAGASDPGPSSARDLHPHGSADLMRQAQLQAAGLELSGSHDLSDGESADLLRQTGLQVEEDPAPAADARKPRRAPPTPTRPMSASLADMLKPQAVPPSGYTPRSSRAYLSDYYNADVVPVAGASSAQVLRAVDGGGQRVQLSEELAALYGLRPGGGPDPVAWPASPAGSPIPPPAAPGRAPSVRSEVSGRAPPASAGSAAPSGSVSGGSSGPAVSGRAPSVSVRSSPAAAERSGSVVGRAQPSASVSPSPGPAAPSVSAGPPSGAAPLGFEATSPAGSPSVVHLLAGGSIRGMVRRFDPAEGLVEVHPRGGAAPERLPLGEVLAVFFGPGSYPEPEAGRALTVRLTNGREVSGLSPDYTDQADAFSLRPADARGHVVRIWISRVAVAGLQLHDA